MPDEKELQKQYIQLYLLKEQFKSMAEEKGAVDGRISEMLVTMDALGKIDSVKSGEEIWSSMGSGAFLRSDIKDTGNVLIGIGAGVVMRKDRKQAVEILKSRLEELVMIDSQMTSELEKYGRQIEGLEERMRASGQK